MNSFFSYKEINISQKQKEKKYKKIKTKIKNIYINTEVITK